MKKTLSLLAFILMSLTSWAQDTTSKKANFSTPSIATDLTKFG